MTKKEEIKKYLSHLLTILSHQEQCDRGQAEENASISEAYLVRILFVLLTDICPPLFVCIFIVYLLLDSFGHRARKYF